MEVVTSSGAWVPNSPSLFLTHYTRCRLPRSRAKGYWACFHAFYCLNAVWTQLFLWSSKLLFCCFITIIKTKLVPRLIGFFIQQFQFIVQPVIGSEINFLFTFDRQGCLLSWLDLLKILFTGNCVYHPYRTKITVETFAWWKLNI